MNAPIISVSADTRNTRVRKSFLSWQRNIFHVTGDRYNALQEKIMLWYNKKINRKKNKKKHRQKKD